MLEHKLLQRDKKYSGFIDLYEDTLEYGDETFSRIVVDVLDASGILVIDKESGDIYLTSQYRHPIEADSIEIAAGLVDEGETPKDAAIREAEEELGYTVKDVELLCKYNAMPGVSNHKLYIYIGYIDSKSEQKLDETEYVEVLKWSNEAFLNYTFEDSKTLLAQLLYKDMMRNG